MLKLFRRSRQVSHPTLSLDYRPNQTTKTFSKDEESTYSDSIHQPSQPSLQLTPEQVPTIDELLTKQRNKNVEILSNSVSMKLVVYFLLSPSIQIPKIVEQEKVKLEDKEVKLHLIRIILIEELVKLLC